MTYNNSLEWFVAIAASMDSAVAKRPEFHPWCVCIAPPGYLNIRLDTATIFAVARQPRKHDAQVVYATICITEDEWEYAKANYGHTSLIQIYTDIALADLFEKMTTLNSKSKTDAI